MARFEEYSSLSRIPKMHNKCDIGKFHSSRFADADALVGICIERDSLYTLGASSRLRCGHELDFCSELSRVGSPECQGSYGYGNERKQFSQSAGTYIRVAE